jgi:hypothetical protein
MLVATFGLLSALAIQANPLAVAHAEFQATIDGSLSEWQGPELLLSIRETAAPTPLGNQFHGHIVWSLDVLLIAGVVDDSDLVWAPKNLKVEQFHQFDSVQIYLDPRNDSMRRMNSDDINILLLPDGRAGVLRGDDLIAELTQAQVPQRQSAPLAYQYAAQRNATGWQFELAIPFASLAILAKAKT